jgi:3-oxoadipate enol-lactonase
MPWAQAPDGSQISYECHDPLSEKDAPVLVALAAMGTTGRLYSDLIESGLQAGYRVVLVEHRSNEKAWSTSLGADDVIAILDALGVERAHITGASLGGMVAQEVAIRHPNRTAALALAATTGGWPRLDLLRLRGVWALVRSNFRRAETTLDSRIERALPVWFSTSFAAKARPGSDAWDSLVSILEDSPSGETRRTQLLAAIRHSTWRRLSAIRAPTLVQHGGEDRVISPRAGQELARRIPKARVHLWPTAGHALGVEIPEESSSLGLDFLKEHDHLLRADQLSAPKPRAGVGA